MAFDLVDIIFPTGAWGKSFAKVGNFTLQKTHFHLSRAYSLEVKPYMDNNLHGLFATRAPARPNPIGLSVVRLVKVKGNMLYIRDIDIVDGTPLLDIKPYIPEFSSEDIIKKGWLENNIVKLSDSKDDGRFIK